jgi:hypothetical protein
MRFRRTFRIGLISAALSAALLLSVSPAGAVAPDNFTVEVDESFSFDDCGFTIEGRTTGFIRGHVFFDKDGNSVGVINNFALKVTYTNPETGETLTTPVVGPDIITFHDDGSVTIASIGIIASIVVPGEGLVAAQIGNIVFFFTDPEDEEPDVTFVAGPHEGDILAALCEALAP